MTATPPQMQPSAPADFHGMANQMGMAKPPATGEELMKVIWPILTPHQRELVVYALMSPEQYAQTRTAANTGANDALAQMMGGAAPSGDTFPGGASPGPGGGPAGPSGAEPVQPPQ